MLDLSQNPVNIVKQARNEYLIDGRSELDMSYKGIITILEENGVNAKLLFDKFEKADHGLLIGGTVVWGDTSVITYCYLIYKDDVPGVDNGGYVMLIDDELVPFSDFMWQIKGEIK